MTQELLAFAAQCGYPLGEITPDGKIHRFKLDSKDHKNSGYYVFHCNYTQDGGRQYFAGLIGDHKSQQEFPYQPAFKLSADDRAAVKRTILSAQKDFEEEKRKKQEEAASDCQEIWPTLETSGDSPYLHNKGLKNGLYGCRIRHAFEGTTTFVPMVDIDGKLCSFQKIYSNGDKLFYTGGRKTGCFHIVGPGLLEDQETIYVAEGLATAASCSDALGKPVVCAFDAGNLVPVARELQREYSDKAFIFCADDDWKNEKNSGKEKAEEAALLVGGTVVLPFFQNREVNGKPLTDFNDLHAHEGLERVRDQLAPVQAQKQYVLALGYDGADYFFVSNVNPQIQKLSAAQLNSSGLARLQPITYWESLFPGKNDTVAWTRAADALIQQCHERGIFRPDRVRHRGVWIDDGRVVYHKGNSLWFGQNEFSLHERKFRSRYTYDSDFEMPHPHESPLTVEECVALLDVAASICWKHRESFMLYAGWCLVAPLGAALPWRPHLWLTGRTDSGKSYVIEQITYRRLLSEYVLYVQGATTEAGLRQMVKSSSRPIIFDEIETNNEQSAARVAAIIELGRQASSSSDGVVAKGTANGTAMHFRPQFSMLVGSIRTNLVHLEDQNRFTCLELEKPVDKAAQVAQYEALAKFVDRLDPTYGHRLFSRAFHKAPEILKSIDAITRHISRKYSTRTGNQYGALLGGYWMLMNDRAATQEDAEKLCSAFSFASAQETETRKDEEECLNFLLEKAVSVQPDGGCRRDTSILEMVQEARESYKANEKELGRLGIKISDGNLCVRNNHRALSEIYRGSAWATSYARSLARLPGARNNVSARLPGEKNGKFVSIPLSLIPNSDQ